MSITGGDKLAKVLAEIGGSANGHVNAGFLSGATYPDGQSVAAVAFWNEFGHGGTFPAPPRPFMRPAVADDAKAWAKTLAGALKHTDYDGPAALAIAGDAMISSIQEHIKTVDGPALSQTTLRLRQMFGNHPEDIRASDVLQAQRDVAEGKPVSSNTKQLNWTGHMSSSVDMEVKP